MTPDEWGWVAVELTANSGWNILKPILWGVRRYTYTTIHLQTMPAHLKTRTHDGQIHVLYLKRLPSLASAPVIQVSGRLNAMESKPGSWIAVQFNKWIWRMLWLVWTRISNFLNISKDFKSTWELGVWTDRATALRLADLEKMQHWMGDLLQHPQS